MGKVFYIGGFDLPDKNAAAQRVIANAKIFVCLDYEVRLCGLSSDDENAYKEFEYEGLMCINLPYPKGNKEWLIQLTSIGGYLPMIENWKPDLIIAYNYPAVALWKLLNYSRRHGIKIIADCTEWYHARGTLGFRLIKNADTLLRMRFVQPRMDGMIAISHFLERYYRNRGMKVLYLPPLVDMNNPKWEMALSQKIDEDGISLFYAGTTSRKDRLDIVIRALMHIVDSCDKEIKLDIVGITDSRFHDIYPQFGQLPDFVHFCGRLPHQEVLNMLVNHDYQIFIREETRVNMAGFPTKYVESISSGTLVLTNYTSDLKDYLKEGITGFPLDISSEQGLEASLLKTLSVSKAEIRRIRNRLNTSQFDYHYFVESARLFLNSIYNN